MLIIHAPDDPQCRYSQYFAAVLRGEGYADLHPCMLEELSRPLLQAHDLVVLPRCALSWDQIDLLTDYVAAGGVLVAAQPDYQLLRRFGLEPIFSGRVGPRICINTALSPLADLSGEAIDVVTPLVRWQIGGDAQVGVLATVDGDAVESRTPAVVTVRHGEGAALLFAYDLPHTIARLRQGDPDNADLGLADCDDANRPNELFIGQLDPHQLHLPQADIHMALLGRAIDALAPRPRLWYYPQPAQQSAMLMTSDEDWSTLEQWQALIDGLRRRKAQCTFFMVAESRIDKRYVDEWEAEGHVFSVHPALKSDYRRTEPKPPTPRQFMPGMLRENIERHQVEYSRPVRTIRQHRVRWYGYVDCARFEAEMGVGMDCNYMSVKPYYIGFMGGSGRALPFVDADGSMVNCYQLSALWSEECIIHESMGFSLKLPVDRAISIARGFVRDAAQLYYTPVCFNSHPVSYATYSAPLVDAAWDQAVELDVPILSADAWLDWTLARDGIRIEATEAGYLLHAEYATPSVVLLLPPGMALDAPGATRQTVTRWGAPYTALTLTNLAAGSKVHLTGQTKAATTTPQKEQLYG